MRYNYIFFKAFCLYGITYQLTNGDLYLGLVPMGIFLGLYLKDLKNEKRQL